MRIKNICNTTLDLVYPPGLYCISCGKITDASRTYGLCNDCMGAVNWITERHCEKCGRPLADTDPGPLCFGCTVTERSVQPHAYDKGHAFDKGHLLGSGHTLDKAHATGGGHAFDKGHACAGYGAAEQAIIFAFKYGGQSHIGEVLGEIMYDRMCAEYSAQCLRDKYDMLVPVPLHIDKKRKRGFNQAELMAKSLSKLSGIRCETELLKRVRSTKAMKALNPEERRANLGGAFEIRERKRGSIQGASILLVDDIFTTGATIDEIARILKEPQTGDNDEIARILKEPRTVEDGQVLPGAARVDFLVFAAAKDIPGF